MLLKAYSKIFSTTKMNAEEGEQEQGEGTRRRRKLVQYIHVDVVVKGPEIFLFFKSQKSPEILNK